MKLNVPEGWTCRGELPEEGNHNEYIAQATSPDGRYIVDIGWYPDQDPNGRYGVEIIKDGVWDKPVLQIGFKDAHWARWWGPMAICFILGLPAFEAKP